MKVISHRRRYWVERQYPGYGLIPEGGWEFVKGFRFAWTAKRYARYWHALGSYVYRVVDSKG